MTKKAFDVTGMTCSACSAHVEKAVRKVEGVQDVQVNLLGNSMNVTFDPDATNEGAICRAVEHAGYGAFHKGDEKSGGKAEDVYKRQHQREARGREDGQTRPVIQREAERPSEESHALAEDGAWALQRGADRAGRV